MGYPPKGRADYLKIGDWNASCSMCGCKMKASELVLNWQGQYRCKEHNEPRQMQDFVRAVPDIQSVPWSQNAGSSYVIQCVTFTSVPNWAYPNCAIPNMNQIQGIDTNPLSTY